MDAALERTGIYSQRAWNQQIQTPDVTGIRNRYSVMHLLKPTLKLV